MIWKCNYNWGRKRHTYKNLVGKLLEKKKVTWKTQKETGG